MPLLDSVFLSIQSIVGPAHVKRAPEDLLCYSFDATGESHMPDAVVFPENEEQVSRIMALAHREKVCVTPRGAGSGMTGGAVPVMGGIVMAMNRMNRIVHIDRDNLFIRVEPGVVTSDIHQAVESIGLFYPPDPASSSVCTIGGNIGECAGGPRAVKYGVTRDYVLGLRAVLPDGKIITTGVDTAKGVAGYDLTRLLTGSEGTLAIVTLVTLRLLPKPERVKTIAVLFDRIETAAGAVTGIMRQSVVPRCVEFMDEAAIDLVRNYFGFEVPKNVKALLIIELDGNADTVKKDCDKIIAYCSTMEDSRIIEATSAKMAQSLWKGRKALSPVLFNIANTKINEDIVVPINRIPEMIHFLETLRQQTGLTVVGFGHAGDGNIHCNIMYDKSSAGQAEKAKKAVDALFEKTLALGGTITGEHGVGLNKKRYLPWEIDETGLEIMKGIKAVFDPGNILNPGKIFF